MSSYIILYDPKRKVSVRTTSDDVAFELKKLEPKLIAVVYVGGRDCKVSGIAQIVVTFLKDKKMEDYEFVLFAGSKYYENLLDYFPEGTLRLPLGKLPIGKRLGVLSTALKTGKEIILEGKLNE